MRYNTLWRKRWTDLGFFFHLDGENTTIFRFTFSFYILCKVLVPIAFGFSDTRGERIFALMAHLLTHQG